MTDTVPVSIQVLGSDLVPGAGRVLGLANVALEVAGFSCTVQGIRIMRNPGSVAVEGPHWRHPRSGEHFPALLLPEELRQAMAEQIMAEVRRRRDEANAGGETASPFGSWDL